MKSNIEMQFNILEINETKEREQIRAAFKRLILKHHPDKNSENEQQAAEKTRKIVEAYNAITEWLKGDNDQGDENTLQNNDNNNNYNETSPSDAVVVYGTRIKIFIPVYVVKEDSYSSLFSSMFDEGFADRGNSIPCVYKQDIEKFKGKNPRKLFENLARQVNAHLSNKHMYYQIGLDPDETQAIFNQHSFYKWWAREVIILEAEVGIAELNLRSSEKDNYGTGCLSAGSGQYFSLKPSITLKTDDLISLYSAGELYAPKRLPISHHAMHIETIKKYLEEDLHWQQLRNITKFKFIPKGIMQMRFALNKISNQETLLKELQSIASTRFETHKSENENNLPADDQSAKKQKLRIGFYKVVAKSSTLKNIADWLTENIKRDKDSLAVVNASSSGRGTIMKK